MKKKMNDVGMLLLLAGAGCFCYRIYFKCIEWFEKI